MDLDPKQLLEKYGPKEAKVLKADRQLGLVRFSPCGKMLAAGGLDGTVRRWNLADESLPELPQLTGHGGFVQALAFHPDGQRMFTADSWGQLRCWPFAEAEAKPQWVVADAHNGWIRGLAISPDGATVATCGSDQAIRLWSAADGKKLTEQTGHHEDVFALAFHPDGKSLVSGDFKGQVKQWELPACAASRQFDASLLTMVSRLQDVGGVRSLAFDKPGSMLAVGGTKPSVGGNVQGTPTILFFDWADGALKHTFKHGADGDGFVYDMSFHADGFVMAVTSGNPGAGKLLFTRPADAQPFFVSTKMANCHSLGVHPGGIRIAVVATNSGSNGNGRQLDKEGKYPGNYSPVYLLDLPQPTAT